MTRINLKKFALLPVMLLWAVCQETSAKETKIVETVVQPQAIVWISDTTGVYVKSPEKLFSDFPGQVSVNNSASCMVLRSADGHKPSLLLDFGKEIYGSVKIYTGMAASNKPKHVRVCMGESVTEAMSDTDILSNPQNPTNEHSMRDYVLSLPWLGSAESSKTGFRFVRVDFVDENDELPLLHIEARSFLRDMEDVGSFACSDSRLTDIWNTGAYTVKLNMQDYVWDGIKRDRLVWLGDMHPEIMTIGNVWGDVDVAKRSLDFARNDTPLPGWINSMSAYSLWWLIIQNDYNDYTGDMAYLAEQLPYTRGLLKQIAGCVSESGEEHLDGKRFLDWPTSENQKAIHSGLQSLTIMAVASAAEIGRKLDDKELVSDANRLLERLRKFHIDSGGNKQAAALAILSGQSTDVDKDVAVILRGGADGFSTFYGYYMIEALAKAGHSDDAQKLISDYWGAMLDLGGTTFWEDLDYNDVKNAAPIDRMVPAGKHDIHADGGDYCYKGLRLSLCHGWASGPTSWMTRHLLGVRPLEPGCSVIEVAPNLGKLEWAKGTFPTPKGAVEISVKKDASGNDVATVKAPEGIKVINRNSGAEE